MLAIDVLDTRSTSQIAIDIRSGQPSKSASAILAVMSSFSQAESLNLIDPVLASKGIEMREYFADLINHYDFSDLSNIKSASTALATISANVNQMNQNTAVTVTQYKHK